MGKHGGTVSMLFLVQDEAGRVICGQHCCLVILVLGDFSGRKLTIEHHVKGSAFGACTTWPYLVSYQTRLEVFIG